MTAQLVYDAITQYYRAYGVPPTRRRLCDLAGLSIGSVEYYLRKLVGLRSIVMIDRHPVPVEIKTYLENYTPTTGAKS
jgi:hypothetical protein